MSNSQIRKKPSILFVHRTFGAQFEFFAKWLVTQGWDVHIAHSSETASEGLHEGMHLWRFSPQTATLPAQHFQHSLEHAAFGAAAAAELFHYMRKSANFVPDVVMAHSGWGVGLMVKSIWPETRYIAYHEWYYSHLDWDSGRAITPTTLGSLIDMRMRNMPITAEFDTADAHWCPSAYQASRFPPLLRKQLTVIHDGVDTRENRPDPNAIIDAPWLRLPRERKLLTYATRGMEPLRGFPQFLAGLAVLQKRRDDFDTIILANETVSYGAALPPNESWRMRLISTLDLDQSRMHVSGMRNRTEYRNVLQASHAHIYFTEPFVTSWSLSEAMAIGCMIIGSNTEPVRELIRDMENGILVDMDDPVEIADMLEWAFDTPDEVRRIRAQCRKDIIHHADAENIFNRKVKLLNRIIAEPASCNRITH